MTIPSEELNALKRTHKFLMELIRMNITEIRKNARNIRKEASSCLHHYPFECHLDDMYEKRIGEFEKMIGK